LSENALLVVWERHRPEMLERVALIERAVTALITDDLSAELLGEAQSAAHTLAGSVGTFGYVHASQLAQEIESELDGAERTNVPDISRLTLSLRGELEAEAAATLSAPSVPVDCSEDRVRVLLLSAQHELCARIVTEARARGIDLPTAGSLQEARVLCEHRRPSIVLLDLSLPAGEVQCAYALFSSEQNAPDGGVSVPVLALTDGRAFAERVEVARRGGQGLLSSSLSAADLLDAAVHRLERERLQATRVLLVDDDPAVLDAMRVLLEGHQLKVCTLANPESFWETLQEVEPELLLLDLDMPGVNGRELCSVVRGDPRWSHLAVIFVTAHGDPQTVESLFASGADDCIAKPLRGSELITRVANRLERIRLHRHYAESDGLTGLATRAKASETLRRLLLLGERFSQPVSVAMLDLDRFKAINDTQGHAAGDSVLRGLGRHLAREFRGDDVVGRWGGEEFIAGMYGMARQDGVRRLVEILKRFSDEPFQGTQGTFRASFSAGVAQFPLDGRDPDEILAAADDALYSAKAAGRAQVLAAKRRAPSEHVDVVCVEDDRALVELLLTTLQTHGYSARAISDGEQARGALCGSHPALRCDVLLLDVDLPGLDGHSLLRQLAQQSLLGSMRVIMLTARASEPETLKTLELGAFDHVAKPFSLPVLMHRVKRAIEA
jgi:diguanylate cyclase (GGDEF)-like protein